MTEQKQDPFGVKAANKRIQAEEKAKAYFYNQKKRKSRYAFIGKFNDEEFEDSDDGILMSTRHYSHKEISHIAQLFVDVYNKVKPSKESASTLEEVCHKIRLCELEGYNNELDKLFESFKDLEATLYYIDLQPRYEYEMSCYFWNPSKQKMTKRFSFHTELTDEEYIYLLTGQLIDRSADSFNRLVFERPELARKISESAKSYYFDDLETKGFPYLIILDEIIFDAEKIE